MAARMSDYDPHRRCSRCGAPSPRVEVCGECEVAQRYEAEIERAREREAALLDALRRTLPMLACQTQRRLKAGHEPCHLCRHARAALAQSESP